MTIEDKDPNARIEPGPDKTIEPTAALPAAVDGAAAGAAAEGTVEPGDKALVDGAAKSEPEVAKPQEDWRDKRIAKLASDKAELAQRLAAFEKPKAEGEAPAMLTQADVDRLANERAGVIAARAEFDARCNAAATEARKSFPDFNARVAELAKIVDQNDPKQTKRYDEFLEAALETGEAGKIIYAMGGDLNEAERILALSPVKRAAELTAMARGEAPIVSNLPKPITPLAGKNSGPGEIDPGNPVAADKLSSAEWHKRRNAQVNSVAPAYERKQQSRR